MSGRGTSIARKLRRNQTDAEKLLWRRLRDRQLGGAKFRRQVPIGGYVVDFMCEGAKLIIELDGGQHVGNKGDETRTADLQAAGFHVVRFWNNDVLINSVGVLKQIAEMLEMCGYGAATS